MNDFIIAAHGSDSDHASEAVRKINDGLKKLKNGLWCILIRQPSLHRHSVQAFRCEAWEHPVIGLPPMITPGYNADFDGDTMAVFLPPSPWWEDLSALSIAASPGRIGDGKIMIAADLDLALGWRALPEDTRVNWSRAAGVVFLENITLDKIVAGLIAHSDNWLEDLKRLQDEVCIASTASCTISPLEFDRLYREMEPVRRAAASRHQEHSKKSMEIMNGTSTGDLKKSYKNTEDSVDNKIIDWLKNNRSTHLASLVLGKAKGSCSDVRNMVAFIGLQDLYSEIEGVSTSESWIGGCFWTGLSDDELFRYSYACRDAMAKKKLATAIAGDLSRLLAEGLYNTVVAEEDCGTSDGIALYRTPENQLSLNILLDGKPGCKWMPAKVV